MNRGITDPERVAPGATNTTPANQATNQDQVWPHRVIRRGDAVRPSCSEWWPASRSDPGAMGISPFPRPEQLKLTLVAVTLSDHTAR